MRRLRMIALMRWVVAILALATIGFAQDEKKKVVPAAPIMAPPAEAAADVDAAYRKLVADYNAAQNAYYAAWRKARAENVAFDQSKHPRNEYLGKFEELARANAGTDVAISAWVMALRCGADRDAVCAVLMKDHIGSEKLVDALYTFSYGSENQAVLGEIAAKSPHRAVKGVAYLLLGANLLRENDSAKADPLLVMCQWKYADVPLYGGRTTVGRKAAGCLFEARNLAIGQSVPEIEGEDTDGVVFKLSDYRGKVVLLDFWGNW